MTEADARLLFDTVMSLAPETLERVELGDAVNAVARLEAFLAHYKVRCARRGNELKQHGRSEDGFAVLASEGHGSAKDAQATVDRDRTCSAVPEIEAALAAGAVSGEHVDVLTRLTKNLTDDETSQLQARGDEIAAAASSESPWLFERHTRQIVDEIKATTRPNSDVEEHERQRAASRITRRTDRDTGMKTTVIELDPIRDAIFHRRIDAHLTRLKREPESKGKAFHELHVEALMRAVAERPASGETSEPSVPEVIVHIDGESACKGRHARTMCETQDGDPVPVATVQRFCCEAAITSVVAKPDGTVTRLFEERTANRRQRRALAAMYSTCAHPDCQAPFSRCRMHHIVWFTNGGATVLANLVPLCDTHHHLVHEGGWTIEMTSGRTITWKRPDGSIWRTHRSTNRRPRAA